MVYNVPGAILSTVNMVTNFISMTALQGRYYYAHFMDKEN